MRALTFIRVALLESLGYFLLPIPLFICYVVRDKPWLAFIGDAFEAMAERIGMI